MKIAINGAGVAGPTLAWWLKHYGHEPVIFEEAPELRTGGYMIDFWGLGYDVAEKMGIVSELHKEGYIMEKMQMVDGRGRRGTAMGMKVMLEMLRNRYLSIERSVLSKVVFEACEGVETRFGCSVVGMREKEDGLELELSDGTKEDFDLLVGADGLHSAVREFTFGEEEKFEKNLGYYVAAFQMKGYQHRDELTYLMQTEVQRQFARVTLRNDMTLFFTVFRADLINKQPGDLEGKKKVLRDVFAKFGGETPEVLKKMDEVDDIYFDRVSQIKMDHWSKGRVALIGDAAACVSLLAGEGTGLAMTEAYILAGELHKADGDYRQAFENYEAKLKQFLEKKQKAALRFAGFFAPKNKFGLILRNIGFKLSTIPIFMKLFLGSALRDDLELPEY